MSDFSAIKLFLEEEAASWPCRIRHTISYALPIFCSSTSLFFQCFLFSCFKLLSLHSHLPSTSFSTVRPSLFPLSLSSCSVVRPSLLPLSCSCFSIFCPSLPFFSFSAAFLPCEVVELKRQNVDINPEYSESLDNELFTVHLMFEKPTAETALAAAAEAQQVGRNSYVCLYRNSFSCWLSLSMSMSVCMPGCLLSLSRCLRHIWLSHPAATIEDYTMYQSSLSLLS